MKIHRYNPWRRHLRALSPGIWRLHSPGADPMLWSVSRSAGHHYANSTKTIDIERRKVRRRRQLAWLTVSKTILGLVQDFQQLTTRVISNSNGFSLVFTLYIFDGPIIMYCKWCNLCHSITRPETMTSASYRIS